MRVTIRPNWDGRRHLIEVDTPEDAAREAYRIRCESGSYGAETLEDDAVEVACQIEDKRHRFSQYSADDRADFCAEVEGIIDNERPACFYRPLMEWFEENKKTGNKWTIDAIAYDLDMVDWELWQGFIKAARAAGQKIAADLEAEQAAMTAEEDD